MGKKGDKLALGTEFYTGYQFKQVVLEYALNKAKNIKQTRWDKTKLEFKCGIGGNCKWKVYCAYDKPSQKWIIKTRYESHSCSRNGKC
ncbi:hypothetical protein V5N11_021345 [Cardamine amara subsp. amara]|uniref:Transposase MuDR plant domain-containing protein n=1 Tax=Cardamine amara subsp. amara TaxID=228776 RepID=A0ABD1AGG7_CARAN